MSVINVANVARLLAATAFCVTTTARDQGVGVYVNGVYLGRAQGLGTALFDIDSVEVLKGPQGTLFGRNTEGGAINITTKKPTGEFHANVVGGLGNFGSYKTEGHIDLPAFAGIALKIDGVVSRRDPIVKNPLSGATGFNHMTRAVCASKHCGSRRRISARIMRSTRPTMRRRRCICNCSPRAAIRRPRWARSSRRAPVSPMSACPSSRASARCAAMS